MVQSIKNSIVLSTTYSMSQSVTYSYVYIRIHERPILAVCSNNAHQTKLWGRNFIHGSKIMLLKQQSFNLYFYLFKKSNAKLDLIYDLLPSMICVVMSWTGFWIKLSVPSARVGLCITTYLSPKTLGQVRFDPKLLPDEGSCWNGVVVNVKSHLSKVFQKFHILRLSMSGCLLVKAHFLWVWLNSLWLKYMANG